MKKFFKIILKGALDFFLFFVLTNVVVFVMVGPFLLVVLWETLWPLFLYTPHALLVFYALGKDT